jgi:type II secretory pathway component PulC
MVKRIVKHFKKAIPLIIITILAIGGVEIFYRILFPRFMQINQEPKAQDAGPKIESPASSEQKKRPDFQTILKRNLFGASLKETKPAAAEQPAADKLAATALDISLLGTITGPPNTRRAILMDKKKRVQDIYYQGDTVQGALIKEIQRGKVILSVNGKEELLVPEIPKSNSGTATNFNSSSLIPPGTGQEIPPVMPVESAVEPQPIVTAEPPAVPPEEPVQNNTPEPNPAEVDRARSHHPNQQILPPNNQNQEKP